MGRATALLLFWPGPLGPCGGVKMSNIVKFQLQSQFQRFLYQTLCVFSQIKDIKYNRQYFYSVAWVMPQGLGLRGVKFIFSKHGHVAY